MAISRIQMQIGMSLPEFMNSYGTEFQCESALVALRWPHGFACPGCGHGEAGEFRRGGLLYWQCKHCRRQTSLYAGTMFEHTRLPLTTWFLAIYLMSQSKTHMSALELRRHLGISWRTAWLMKQKLMEAMFQRERGRPLKGTVSIDDAYLGGEVTGSKAGRGSPNKVPFVAAVELHKGRPVRVRFDRVKAFSFAALRDWYAVALEPGATVTSDGLLGFEVLTRDGFEHDVVLAPKGKAGTEIEPFRWLNTILGYLKTAISGTHHAFNFRKYGHRYLADAQYRFNRRFDLKTLPARLAVAMLSANPCPARKLRMPAEIGT